ncbi:hypothetical protein HOY34_08795 [Xinfangfangia sp. D13-10-4-6]|nr:hypothetical protein [Pseudogemmobacter hezensis]
MTVGKTEFTIGGVVSAAIVAIISLFGSFYTVDEGERGVIVSFGTVQGTADPGIHFKMPIITSVHTVPLRCRCAIRSPATKAVRPIRQTSRSSPLRPLHITCQIPADRVEEVYRE